MSGTSQSVLVAGARTPVTGRGTGPLSAVDAGAVAIRAALDRAGIAGHDVGHVVVGGDPASDPGPRAAREAALKAGVRPSALPLAAGTGAAARGLSVLARADALVRSGAHEIVIAAGLEALRAPLAREPELAEALLGRFVCEAAARAASTVPEKDGARHWAERAVARAPASVPAVRICVPEAGARGVREAAPVPGGAAAVVVDRALADSLGLGRLALISAYAAVTGSAGSPAALAARALEEALERAGLTAAGLDHVEVDRALPAGSALLSRRLPAPARDPAAQGADLPDLPLGASGPRIALHLAQVLHRGGGTFGAAVRADAGRGEALIIRGGP
ncbi:hypothetical protein ACN20G_36480 (plasmid) [Streptomyces sp. BI20]|uniref:thiolase family protein n=1 Tax=Streptomyces sp. BI20 TaxID=3403460 RepID=UPI003C793688